MTEKYIPKVEQNESHEKPVDSGNLERVHKHKAEQAEKARQEKSTENLAKIQELAKIEAKAAEKITSNEQPQQESDSLIGTTQSLKATAFKRTLARTQQKLPKGTRAFSKIVHNSTVDRVSAVSSQTVARPSGFLGGSIFAFLGSLTVYYFSKHYGFRYNYLLLLMFFVAGYLIGVTLELLVWLVYTRKQRY